MREKKYKENYAKKVFKKKIKEKRTVDWPWIVKITLTAFLISLILSAFSEKFVPNINIFFSLVLLLVIILIGILFDMIGIATTAADIKTFNSMATKNVRGSKLAVYFIKEADKVSSFCNDVIGDICGIISGSVSVSVALVLSSLYKIDLFILSFVITAIVAALTIGGKAIAKSLAVNKSNVILYEFARILSYFYKKKS